MPGAAETKHIILIRDSELGRYILPVLCPTQTMPAQARLRSGHLPLAPGMWFSSLPSSFPPSPLLKSMGTPNPPALALFQVDINTTG